LRFFAAKLELSDGKAGYFTNVDGINRFALVAVDPERPEEIIAVVSFAAPATTWTAACPWRSESITRPRRASSYRAPVVSSLGARISNSWIVHGRRRKWLGPGSTVARLYTPKLIREVSPDVCSIFSP